MPRGTLPKKHGVVTACAHSAPRPTGQSTPPAGRDRGTCTPAPLCLTALLEVAEIVLLETLLTPKTYIQYDWGDILNKYAR